MLLFFSNKPALDCEEFDLFDPVFKGVIFVIGNFRPYEKMSSLLKQIKDEGVILMKILAIRDHKCLHISCPKLKKFR